MLNIKNHKHIQHYIPLISILLAGLLGIAIFSYDTAFQAAIVVATSASYVAWGLVHHYIHKDLHLSVFFEYLLIAILGVVIVLSVIFRA